jgi:ParB/RepB/Spo0J family partition protein
MVKKPRRHAPSAAPSDQPAQATDRADSPHAAPTGPHAQGPTLSPTQLMPIELLLTAGNDRREVSPEGLESLAASMAQHGQQQAIGVGPINPEGKHQVVWGFRRVEAARRLGWRHVLAIVVDAQAGAAAELRLTENLQREQLTAAEQAVAVARLYQADTRDVPDERRVQDIASRLGVAPRWVRDHLYLTRLAPGELDLVHSGRLPLPHAREVCKLADDKLRSQLVKLAAAPDPESLPMSLEQLRQRVTERLLSLAEVPWRLDEQLPGVAAPACQQCPSNTNNDMQLFGDLPDADERILRPDGHGVPKRAGEGPFCLSPKCYRAKESACRKALRSAAPAALTQLIRADVTLNGANLQERKLVPTGVRPEALLSEARSVRAAKSKRAAAKAEAAKPEGKKNTLSRWEVENLVRTAQRERAERVRATAAEQLRTALATRPMQQISLVLLITQPEWRSLLSWQGRQNVKRFLGPAMERLRAFLAASTPAELMAREPRFNDVDCGCEVGRDWSALVMHDLGDEPDDPSVELYRKIWHYMGIIEPLPAMPDPKAVEQDVIADLVQKGKIAPPPGFKPPAPAKGEKPADKPVGTSPQAEARRARRRAAQKKTAKQPAGGDE